MKIHDFDKKRSYVLFTLGNENFAVIVNRVLEILHLSHLTYVPNTSEYIKGILNFPGSIVPVINLHKRFNFNEHISEGKMVIVIEVMQSDKVIQMGLLVEEVSNVIEFEYKDIQTVPDIGIKYNPDFLEGFVEINGRFMMILNVDRVMSISELAEVTEASQASLVQ
jgi:purine-binding chemotaxis protein CheW